MIKCLIVDDDELGRELIAEYLSGIADCSMAENGLQGVDMFRTEFESGKPYDLIILDIVMPEMDGHTAAKEIRQIEKEWGVSINDGVSIIVLSSLNTPQDVIQAYMSAKSAAHLLKPVEPGRLLSTLSKLEIGI
ncbi:MAG: response regulator [Desulfuromonadaceae bacterium]|nr:response regulator [Desulfuromonadaceae bacterium]MDD2856238.1 response regulator [Desulfuromonadaceae bacterium]